MVTVTPRNARRATKAMREGNEAMKSEITGITRANEGMQGIS